MSRNPLGTFLTPAAAADGSSPVDAILDAVREHLGMEIAFASRFTDGRREFTNIRSSFPVPAVPGDSELLEDSFCHRILAGRLPQLIHDAQDYDAALEMDLTRALPVGAHLNVPLRLADGSVYGTFCCLSRDPDYSLTNRDLNTLKAFADLAAGHIERDLIANHRQSIVRQRIEAVLAEDRIGIVFQPIHRLADGTVVGVEALSRFSDLGGEWPLPSDWFAAAADAGLGLELELLAIESALLALPYLPSNLYLSVNASPQTVASGALEPLLRTLPANRIVIELTEHSLISEFAGLEEAVARLRGLARIAIDDVGAGYSGLRRIVDLKPDLLKLDMGLTRQVDCDESRSALAQALVGFSRRTGSKMIAEGVETLAEAELLRAIGVGYGQGYLFSRPMPAVALLQFLLGATRGPPSMSPVRPSEVPTAKLASA